MTISLNSVTLSEDLIWVNEFDEAMVAQTIKHTILGKIIVASSPNSQGKVIILQATRSGNVFSGYFTRTQIQQFKALELSVTPVPFTYNGDTYTVFVQAGGVSVAPLIARENIEDDDWYTGTLILVEV